MTYRVDVFDCIKAFENAHIDLLATLPREELREFNSNTAIGWKKHRNITVDSQGTKWIKFLEFETEADYTAFLLKWG